jgi:hypothetical protein
MMVPRAQPKTAGPDPACGIAKGDVALQVLATGRKEPVECPGIRLARDHEVMRTIGSGVTEGGVSREIMGSRGCRERESGLVRVRGVRSRPLIGAVLASV